MKRHVSGRPHRVAPTADARVIHELQIYVKRHGHRRAGLPQRQNTPYLARFSWRKSISFSAVLPISIPQKQSFCGNPSVFCGKEEAPAPKAKAFHRKTEQMRRVPTTGQASRRYSRSICPVFVGATLRGRPSMGKISFQCRPRRHATNFVHFAVLLLMTGSSFIPQKFCFCGILPCKARPVLHFSRAATRVSGSGDHIGSPLRMSVCPFRNPRHSVKGFSTRHSRALAQASRLWIKGHA